jgi:uncharacterized surface protein with fasciclin (FAS1) repeats
MKKLLLFSSMNKCMIIRNLFVATWVFLISTVAFSQNTVVDIISNSEDHDTLEIAITAAGLDDDLAGTGPFTVFAPTDAAFAALPAGVLDALLADPHGDLIDVLLYHVLNASVASTALTNGQFATTMDGDSVVVTISGSDVFINNAQVTTADISADNGIVHVIDAVLDPGSTVYEVVASSPDHTTLDLAVTTATLQGTLSGPGPFTLFAPTDAAFAALPAGVLDGLVADPAGALTDVLLYHVINAEVPSHALTNGQFGTTVNGDSVVVTISGTDVFINNAKVTTEDITTDNGIVHVIDAVLVPGSTVYEVVGSSPDHTTLDLAVTTATLQGTLSGPGPFTVFAPTDAAFNALPAGVLDGLVADPTGALTDVLLYHVLSASVGSSALTNGQFASTMNGDSVVVTISGTDVFINNAKVTTADITTDNGIVHVIDAVLVPGTTVYEVVASSPDHTTLEVGVTTAGLQGTLSGPGPFTVFAPTDAAFDALPDGVLDAVLADPEGLLTNILLYHVIGAEVPSHGLTNGQFATTVNGDSVVVTITDTDVYINSARVTTADINTDNGIVHIIDAALVPGSTVYEVVASSPDHLTLDAAITAATLQGTLSGLGPFTVFAPTDAAFDALPDGVVDDLLLDPTGELTQILLYHVVSGKALSTDLSDGQMITTLNGDSVMVTISGTDVFIDTAQVTVVDIETDNGVVHVIDAVLVPYSTVWDVIVGSPDHTTLETAILAAGLDATLEGTGPFTVFAPTDAAFDALPDGVLDGLVADPTGALTDVLLYHVLSGSVESSALTNGQFAITENGDSVVVTISGADVYINNALVTTADIMTNNGIVHVIDAVLVPGSTVYEVVVTSPDHATLEVAINAAELQGTLSGPGPFTLFAPTDAAFDALPDGVVDDLLLDPTGELTQILLYHVVSGKALSTDLSDGQMITTLNGDSVMVTISGTDVFIDTAQVTVVDIETDNGVVHVIDAVLVPYSTVWDVIVGSPDHTTLETAILAAGLDATLEGTGPFTVFAPTDAAFDALPDGVLDGLVADPTGALTDVLLYHVLSGSLESSALTNGQFAITENGDSVVVTISGADVYINNALVTTADIMTNNGIVHVIDAVLVPGSTVYEVVVTSPDHATLEVAINAAELQGTLSGPGPFTLFAPTDAAFDALPDGVVDDLLLDPTGELTQILLYHVVSGKALSTDLSDGQMITTLNGDSVMVTISGTDVFIDTAQVTVVDIETDNGVVHVIDAVLVPYSTVWDVIVGSPDHTTLETAILAAGLDATLEGTGPFTVFAPTDAAFDALPDGVLDGLVADPTGALTDVLLYHVLSGSLESSALTNGQFAITENGDSVVVTISGADVYINNALVTTADIMTNNGIVHVIDAVLVPGSTVYEVVVTSPDHATLEVAINAAELQGTLSGPGPFTLFAPTDAAFAALPGGVLDDLLDDPTGALADVLLYHVLDSKVLSTDLSDGMTATTLEGSDITVTINQDGIFINDAKVTTADIETDNGVVHVIDAVLTPSTGVPEISPEESDVLIYPNPASYSFYVRYEVVNPSDISIEMFNMMGQKVAIKQLGFINKGIQTCEFPVSDLKPGMYILIVNLDNRRVARKVKINR